MNMTWLMWIAWVLCCGVLGMVGAAIYEKKKRGKLIANEYRRLAEDTRRRQCIR